MKTCGIMIAKENSNRYPGKNRNLFEDNLKILISTCGNENVYMFSNDCEIIKISKGYDVNILDRKINAIDDEQSYLDLLKYCYMDIDKEYDYIISILANSIKNKKEDIEKGLNIFNKNNKISLCRSYNDDGIQSGVFIFRPQKFPLIWYDEGCILNSGKEIHYEDELL